MLTDGSTHAFKAFLRARACAEPAMHAASAVSHGRGYAGAACAARPSPTETVMEPTVSADAIDAETEQPAPALGSPSSAALGSR